jgi:hypothetical protein
LVQSVYPKAIVDIGSLIAHKEAIDILDSYGMKLNHTTHYEWNLMRGVCSSTGKAAFDMDGVLCEDWSYEKTDYEAHLENANPYMIPPYHIEYIITARFEKHRPKTEAWLERWGVKYSKLVMRDEAQRDPIAFKIKQVVDLKPDIMIESSDVIARKINWHTSIPVICIDTMRIFS